MKIDSSKEITFVYKDDKATKLMGCREHKREMLLASIKDVEIVDEVNEESGIDNLLWAYANPYGETRYLIVEEGMFIFNKETKKYEKI